jgi:hypothetical protein
MIYVNGRPRKYIFMAAEVLEEFNFSQRAFSQDPFGEDVRNLYQPISLTEYLFNSDRFSGIDRFGSTMLGELKALGTRQSHRHPGQVPW